MKQFIMLYETRYFRIACNVFAASTRPGFSTLAPRFRKRRQALGLETRLVGLETRLVDLCSKLCMEF